MRAIFCCLATFRYYACQCSLEFLIDTVLPKNYYTMNILLHIAWDCFFTRTSWFLSFLQSSPPATETIVNNTASSTFQVGTFFSVLLFYFRLASDRYNTKYAYIIHWDVRVREQSVCIRREYCIPCLPMFCLRWANVIFQTHKYERNSLFSCLTFG